MKRVVGIGANVLDTVICMREYPAEDKKARAESVFSTGGGPVGNALVALARLGVSAEYLGGVSDDENGARLLEEFARFGVRTDRTVCVKGTKAFTSYILLSEKSGSRTCVFDRGTLPDREENVLFSAIDGADVLHLDGNYLRSAIAAAKYARGRGVKVSLDAGGNYEGIGELLPYADILIPSEEFALAQTGKGTAEEAMLALQSAYSPEVLAVTQGAKGGLYYEDGACRAYPGFPVRCVDSNGSGDTFHGAFLAAYLRGMAREECCRFASAAAAIKCTRAGVRNALPDYGEVQKFLSERK